jgi:hypothetical protein
VDADWDSARDLFALATNQGPYVDGIGFVTDGLGSAQLTSIALGGLDLRTLSVGTDHDGVFVTSLPDPVAAPVLAEASQASLVVRPSPFVNDTTVEFSVRDASRETKLDVFTVDGRRVRSLVNGSLAVGRHVVSWDGRSAQGVSVAPGVYFLRFENGHATTQRVVRLGD